MSEYVYLNGEIVPAADARISPLDKGFLFGDGLYESVRLYGGIFHMLRRHIERIQASADFVGMILPSGEEMKIALYSLARANGASNGAFRITISRGPLGTEHATVLMHQRELPEASTGEAVASVKTPRGATTLAKHKTLNLLEGILAMNSLPDGIREGIFISHEGHVLEGTSSNVFFAKDGELVTPPLSCDILPGVLRGRVVELAKGSGISVREEKFSLSEMKRADECFYTNSLREIVPVLAIDGQAVGGGVDKTITEYLHRAYMAELANDDL